MLERIKEDATYQKSHQHFRVYPLRLFFSVCVCLCAPVCVSFFKKNNKGAHHTFKTIFNWHFPLNTALYVFSHVFNDLHKMIH